MNELTFLNKALLITHKKKSVLVLGDIHLGYGEGLRRSGIFLPRNFYQEIIQDFDALEEALVSHTLDHIIILGDLKHEIGFILRDEWSEVLQFIEHISKRCPSVIVVKGNHDMILEPILAKANLSMVDFYLWEGYAFVHGDRDFKELYDSVVHTWVMGHFHPAITLEQGVTKESYKCFLIGLYKKKKIIMMPSFFTGTEGTDPRDTTLRSPWEFPLDRFEVYIYDKGSVLHFGRLGKI